MKVFVVTIHFRYYPAEWGFAVRYYTPQRSIKIVFLCFQIEIYLKQENDESPDYEDIE